MKVSISVSAVANARRRVHKHGHAVLLATRDATKLTE
jgi:hypothetical protein